MSQVKIGTRIIGKEYPPFIIAEAGINHNGELNKAYDMIRVAREAGADAVKFQTFKAEEFIGDPTLTYTYKSQGTEITESMLDMFKRYEFTEDQWYLIKKKCDEEKIIFLSTPQNRTDLDVLLKINIPAIKVGSDDFTNIPLLKSYVQTALPIIISCGMADLAEVYNTLEAIGSFDGYPTILLLCTSQYPVPPEDINLLKLKTLAHAFPMVILGFSDHSQGSLASALAVPLGAVVFEKHFTLDNNLPGPDHWFSENPQGLQEWISSIKKAFIMMGEGIVRPTENEKKMRRLARRSILATKDIEQGCFFTVDNISLRRPGDGLPPYYFEHILGLRSIRKINRNELIKLGDFE
jgi:sialic acid synthase SpsE